MIVISQTHRAIFRTYRVHDPQKEDQKPNSIGCRHRTSLCLSSTTLLPTKLLRLLPLLPAVPPLSPSRVGTATRLGTSGKLISTLSFPDTYTDGKALSLAVWFFDLRCGLFQLPFGSAVRGFKCQYFRNYLVWIFDVIDRTTITYAHSDQESIPQYTLALLRKLVG